MRRGYLRYLSWLIFLFSLKGTGLIVTFLVLVRLLRHGLTFNLRLKQCTIKSQEEGHMQQYRKRSIKCAITSAVR